jgi:hypothetical protein
MTLIRTTLMTLTFCCTLAVAQDSRAVEVLQRAQQAAGGIESLSAVHDEIVTRRIRSVGGGISGQQTMKIILPNALRQESALPFGMVTLSLVDGHGQLRSPQGTITLGGPQLLQAQGELFRLRLRLLLADKYPSLTLTYLDAVDHDGRPADVLNVTDSESGQSVQMWIDHHSGEFFQSAYDSVALVGGQQLTEHYSDFRTVDGIQVPFAVGVYSNGVLLTDIRIEKVLHNTGLTKAELR